MKFGKCCGGIIFTKEDGELKYLVIKAKQSGGGHWNFPKGHVEEGETEHETAIREIYEEVGLKVNFIEGYRKSTEYYDKINDEQKTVVFFLCEALNTDVNYVFDEVDDHKWLVFDEALEILNYDNVKFLLNLAHNFILENL